MVANKPIQIFKQMQKLQARVLFEVQIQIGFSFTLFFILLNFLNYSDQIIDCIYS